MSDGKPVSIPDHVRDMLFPDIALNREENEKDHAHSESGAGHQLNRRADIGHATLIVRGHCRAIDPPGGNRMGLGDFDGISGHCPVFLHAQPTYRPVGLFHAH